MGVCALSTCLICRLSGAVLPMTGKRPFCETSRMETAHEGCFSRNQYRISGCHWWERIPQSLATVAVTAWSRLPRIVRAPLIPLGRWSRTDQTVSMGSTVPADTVRGVAELRMQGFEPIEAYTGYFWVAHLWPDHHRRSVTETRPAWLDDPHSDGRLWLVRSPWPGLTVEESLNVLWTWVERDLASLDDDLWTRRVTEALDWDAATAIDWHRRLRR